MQTTLARRQRRRRALQRRPQGRTGTTFGQILIVLFVVFVVTTGSMVGAGAIMAVGAYNHYAEGLPDPKTALTNIDFEQQTVIYDRTGKVELARLGDLKRELVTFDELPGEIIDATTAIEDKDFWVNPGFDPAGIVSAGIDTLEGRPRGASTITQQLVRARLLPPEAFEGTTYERKAREIIQSIRLTQAFPGEEGKKTIITAYLNQNFYGNQSYGVKAAAKSYFGKSLADLTLAQDALLAAIPQSPTKFDLVRNAEEICLENVAEGDECTKFKLVVPQDSEVVQRRNHILDLMKARSTLTAGKHTDAEFEAAKLEPVELAPADLGRLEGAPVRLAGPPRARRDAVPGPSERLSRGRYRRLQGHHHARPGHADERPRSGSTSRPAPPTRRIRAPSSPAARSRRPTAPGSSACAATTSITPRRPSPTIGPARSSPTSARPATRPRATRSSSRSSTCWPTAGGSRARRSSRSTTRSASTTRR